MKNRILATIALAGACVLFAPMTAKAADYNDGWNQDSKGWWYWYSDSQTYAKDEVIWDDEKMYYINDAGYMTTGWSYDADEVGYGGTWRYSNEKGEIQTGWQYLGGNWYYLGGEYSDGRMYKCGSYTIDGVKYCFKPTGEMVTGWYNYAGTNSVYGDWVYCNADGSAYDGWLQSGGKWYYLDNGSMRTGYVSLVDGEYETGYSYDDDAKVYYLGRDGAMITGWYDVSRFDDNSKSTAWMYANADGTITKQWVQSGNDWYYVDSWGDMVQSGTRQIYNKSDVPADYVWDSSKTDEENHKAQVAADKAYKEFFEKHTYIFGVDGKMVVGWAKFTDTYGEAWYHADSNGVATTGWIQDGGKWYYCHQGHMLQNAVTPDGYYVGPDGVWVN